MLHTMHFKEFLFLKSFTYLFCHTTWPEELLQPGTEPAPPAMEKLPVSKGLPSINQDTRQVTKSGCQQTWLLHYDHQGKAKEDSGV